MQFTDQADTRGHVLTLATVYGLDSCCLRVFPALSSHSKHWWYQGADLQSPTMFVTHFIDVSHCNDFSLAKVKARAAQATSGLRHAICGGKTSSAIILY